MENNKNKKVNKLQISMVILSAVVIAIILAVTISYLNAPKKVINEELNGGTVNLTYTDDNNSLLLKGENVKKYSDTEGMKQNRADMYFDFTVAVELDEADKVDYEISVVPSDKTTVPVENIKVYLERVNSGTFSSVSDPIKMKLETNKTELGSRKGSMVLDKVTKKKTGSDNYRLRAWVDSFSNYSVKDTDIIELNIEVNGKAL